MKEFKVFFWKAFLNNSWNWGFVPDVSKMDPCEAYVLNDLVHAITAYQFFSEEGCKDMLTANRVLLAQNAALRFGYELKFDKQIEKDGFVYKEIQKKLMELTGIFCTMPNAEKSPPPNFFNSPTENG